MLDITILVCLAILAALMGYLGVHITLHPPRSTRDKNFYKAVFASITVVSVVLIIWQGVRNGQSQERFQSDVRSARDDARAARDESRASRSELDGLKGETSNLRGQLTTESARREQAQKDMALIVQKSGSDTRVGVAEDIRKSPIQVDVKPTADPLKISVQFLKTQDTNGGAPYSHEFLVLTNQLVTPVRLLIQCKQEILEAGGSVMGSAVQASGGWGGKFSPNQYGIGISMPAWTPATPLRVTVKANSKELGPCGFAQQ